MISKKAKYALKALKVLAQSYEKGPLLISHIAESENIPKKFLEAILLELRNHGILQSQKGKGGGYYLRIPPKYTICFTPAACAAFAKSCAIAASISS